MRTFIKIIDQKAISVLILILTDMLMYALSFFVAYLIRAQLMVTHINITQIQPFDFYLQALPLVFVILFGVFYTFGLYQRKNRISGMIETYHVLRAVTFCWILIMAASFLQKIDYSRGMVIIFWICSLIFMSVGRYTVRQITLYLIKKGYGHTRILIVGAGKVGKNVGRELARFDHFGFDVVGFLDDKIVPKKGSPLKVLGKVKDIISVIERYRIDDVYIADPTMSYEAIIALMHECDETSVRFKVVSGLFEIVSGGVDISEIEGIPSLDMKKTDHTIGYEFSKRVMDLIVAIVGFVVLLPIWLFIVIAIRIDSPGAALFKQERVGHHGKKFVMWKFRTMYKDVKEQDFAPRKSGDRRVTRVGRVLRKTSLDELPQLFNVIVGNMSVVGPRPEMPFIVDKYTEWQKRRLDVKPGITGLWQILGRKDLPLHDNIEYDFYYIKNRSIFLDIVIIIKTVLVVFSGKGAY